MNKRPTGVTIAGWIFIAAGAAGFLLHVTAFNPRQPIEADFVWIEAVRLIAIVCGVYVLRGRNWARWMAVAWLLLFHRRATRYFRPAEMQ